MEETFLVHINISKIIACNQAAHYTMLIDSSKMSIVYEFVEWIRWMFSLEYCFYLTHENSVIHELEDIQLLSKLKNFDILPCGQPHCVHQKSYRTLLQNLNLIVSWNNKKVHKYFLDKVNQMNQKITQKNNKNHILDMHSEIHVSHKSFNTENFSSEKVNLEDIKCHSNEYQEVDIKVRDTLIPKKVHVDDSCYKPTLNGESQSEIKDNKAIEKVVFLQPDQNFSLINKSKYISSEIKTSSDSISNNTSSVCTLTNSECVVNKEKVKNSTKPKASNKYPRPFSLGKILSNLREDLGKKMKEPSSFSENHFGPNEECNSDNKIYDEDVDDDDDVEENPLSMQGNTSRERKRQRTRKRKKLRKQNIQNEDFAFSLEDKKRVCILNTPKPDCNVKPSHIRFDIDVDDYKVNLESIEGDKKNEFDISLEELNNISASEILKNESEKFISVLNNTCQDLAQSSELSYLEKNGKEEMIGSNDSVNQTAKDDIPIDLQGEACKNVSQSLNSPSNSESAACNSDLNNLLAQKEKFKKAVIFQRFY